MSGCCKKNSCKVHDRNQNKQPISQSKRILFTIGLYHRNFPVSFKISFAVHCFLCALGFKWIAVKCEEGFTLDEAVVEFGVKTSTLCRRTKNPIPNRVGRPATFTTYEEDVLASLLLGFSLFSGLYFAVVFYTG